VLDGVIAAVRSRKTAPVQRLLEPILEEYREGCELVAGTAATMTASLVDTEESFHNWRDSLQDLVCSSNW